MAEKKCLLLQTQSKVYEGNDVDMGPSCLLNSCFTYRQMVLILNQRRSIYNRQQWMQGLVASQDVLNKANRILTPKQDDFADSLRLREGCGWWSYSECKKQETGRRAVGCYPWSIANTFSQQLPLPALGLPKTTPISSQSWAGEETEGLWPSMTNY